MPFLLPNQQRQSTEGMVKNDLNNVVYKIQKISYGNMSTGFDLSFMFFSMYKRA